MSEAQPSDGEVSQDNMSQDDTETARCSGKTKASSNTNSTAAAGKSKKRRSKYELLEEKFNEKLADIDKNMEDKMDKFLNQMSGLMQKQSQRLDDMSAQRSQRTSSPERSQRPSTSEGGSQRPLSILERELSQRHSPDRYNESGTDSDDEVSLRPSRKERDEFSDHESDTKSDNEIDNDNGKTKRCLFDLFGADAINSKSDKKTGIVMDDSQKQVLSSSWRAEKPNSITAFAEETKESFPVDEETENYLEVPSLDDIIERCLIKKHGRKASFTKTGKSLFSQPFKMVEKIAYRGQQAAYIGIISQLYVQQGLGTLIETLSENDCDINKAIQQIRDIFAMTTKGLDQLGRTGAFHHIIRRQLAMSDTSLFTLEDNRDISDLPLSSKGVFGEKLESTLKSNKEKKKTLDDLLPSFETKTHKRKSKDNESSASSAKKNFQEKDRNNNTVNNSNNNNFGSSFRIPKIPQGQQGFDKKNKSGGNNQFKGKGDGPKGRGAGKGQRKQ